MQDLIIPKAIIDTEQYCIGELVKDTNTGFVGKITRTRLLGRDANAVVVKFEDGTSKAIFKHQLKKIEILEKNNYEEHTEQLWKLNKQFMKINFQQDNQTDNLANYINNVDPQSIQTYDLLNNQENFINNKNNNPLTSKAENQLVNSNNLEYSGDQSTPKANNDLFNIYDNLPVGNIASADRNNLGDETEKSTSSNINVSTTSTLSNANYSAFIQTEFNQTLLLTLQDNINQQITPKAPEFIEDLNYTQSNFDTILSPKATNSLFTLPEFNLNVINSDQKNHILINESQKLNNNQTTYSNIIIPAKPKSNDLSITKEKNLPTKPKRSNKKIFGNTVQDLKSNQEEKPLKKTKSLTQKTASLENKTEEKPAKKKLLLLQKDGVPAPFAGEGRRERRLPSKINKS